MVIAYDQDLEITKEKTLKRFLCAFKHSRS